MKSNLFGNASLSIDKNNNNCVLRVSELATLERIIIPTFEYFNLNTKKYLDYVDWYKAYQLIKEGTYLSIDGQKVILNLKLDMNSKRSNFNLPIDHKLVITKYWLLGFTEGDG